LLLLLFFAKAASGTETDEKPVVEPELDPEPDPDPDPDTDTYPEPDRDIADPVTDKETGGEGDGESELFFLRIGSKLGDSGMLFLRLMLFIG